MAELIPRGEVDVVGLGVNLDCALDGAVVEQQDDVGCSSVLAPEIVPVRACQHVRDAVPVDVAHGAHVGEVVVLSHVGASSRVVVDLNGPLDAAIRVQEHYVDGVPVVA